MTIEAAHAGETFMAGDYRVRGVSLRDEMGRQRAAARQYAGHIIAAPVPGTTPVVCGQLVAGDLAPQTLPNGQIVVACVTGCEHALTIVACQLALVPDWPVGEALAAMWLALRILRQQPLVPGELIPPGAVGAPGSC